MENQNFNEDPRLKNIIFPGIIGDFVIIGFPYDKGAKRAENLQGQENGPDCMMRFLPKCGPLINPEYQIDISNLKIGEYGNIEITDHNASLEELHQKLQLKVGNVINNGGIPISIGGSSDIYYGSFSGLTQICSIIISPKTMLSQRFSEIDSSNASYFCFKEFSKAKQIYFATQDSCNSNTENEFIKDNPLSIENISLNSIRFSPNSMENNEFLVVSKLNNILQANPDPTHVSFNIEAINSAYCSGVSNPSIVGGLTCEEAISIMMALGKNRNIRSLDIHNYNPSIEDFRTGRLISNLIYYFILGTTFRK